MSLQSVLPVAIVLLAAYNLYANKLGSALMTIGFAAVVFALTKSKVAFAAILLLGAFQKQLMGLFEPTLEGYKTDSSDKELVTLEEFKKIYDGMNKTNEGFQARDPVSVHTRIESVDTGVPLANKNALPADYNILNSSAQKLNTVTGVLESASILDNTPLMGMEQLSKEGVPGASIPSSAKARVLIYPPAEESVPAIQREAMNPKDNPYLQTGQDRLAEEVAQAQRGTDLYAEDSADFEGVGAGAGPAF
jgi:hypothetical protein